MLVIVEKPMLAQCLHPVLTQLYPAESFEYLISHPYGMPFVFDYPSKLSWHEYPLWRDAAYRLNPETQRRLVCDAAGRFRSVPCNYADVARHQHAIAVTDQHSSAILAAQRLRELLHRHAKYESWLGTVGFFSLAEVDIRRQLSRPLDDDSTKLACASAQLKADFDFSFLVNSAGLLTRCYAAAGGQAHSPVLSKYMVQTLYAVRQLQARQVNGVPLLLTEGKLHSEMQHWKGTGRYASEQGFLGSAASRGEIIDKLTEYGLLESLPLPRKKPAIPDSEVSNVTEAYHPPHRITLSTLGHAFLARLHPDCEDPDLPFRIAQWQANPHESRAAAQRYIRTWFGKQKRFMR